ncbi:hypothetical protein CJ178_13635 [Rhodococcus sp. ACPA4]|nr:hypothetical protein CJ178_13635 [Rhodococcus sp. ACPA4]ROZ49769.1 hypothetical protein EEB13_07775 [Rhodococcus sp. WS3]
MVESAVACRAARACEDPHPNLGEAFDVRAERDVADTPRVALPPALLLRAVPVVGVAPVRRVVAGAARPLVFCCALILLAYSRVHRHLAARS